MLSPRSLMGVLVPSVVLFVALLLWWVMGQTRIGFSVHTDDAQQLSVSQVSAWMQAEGLQKGDKLVALVQPNGEQLQLLAGHFQAGTLARRKVYSSTRDYYDDQELLHEFWHSPNVSLLTQPGKLVKLVGRSVSFAYIHSYVVWPLVFGGVAWLLSTSVWVWHVAKPEANYLMLNGLGFLLLAASSALSGIPGIVYAPWLNWGLHWLFVGSHFLFLVFGAVTILYFPKPLKKAKILRDSLIALGVLLILLACWVNAESVERWHKGLLFVSDRQIYLAILFAYISLLIIVALQWRQSRYDPLARVQTYWVAVAWLLGPSIYMVLYFVPMFFDTVPLLSRVWSWSVLCLSTLILVLVIGRFKLLADGTYFKRFWLWSLVTLLFIVIDFALVWGLQVAPQVSTLIIVMSLVWVYFPIQYWLLRVIERRRNQKYTAMLQLGVSRLFADVNRGGEEQQAYWLSLLGDLFAPMDVQVLSDNQSTRLRENGQYLCVASMEKVPAVVLKFADQGSRLFDRNDVDLVVLLQFLEMKLMQFQQAFDAGRDEERHRIKRDLHDQIGHQLLSLVYAAHDERSRCLAKSLMLQVRQVIRSLEPMPLGIELMINDVKQMAEAFAENTQVQLRWTHRTMVEGVLIPSSSSASIVNICRELLANAVRHGDAKNVEIGLELVASELLIQVQDDGVGFQPLDVVYGNGLNNISQRIAELGGSLTWTTGKGMRAEMTIPLE